MARARAVLSTISENVERALRLQLEDRRRCLARAAEWLQMALEAVNKGDEDEALQAIFEAVKQLAYAQAHFAAADVLNWVRKQLEVVK